MQSLALACLAEGYVVAGKVADASRVATQAIDLARVQGHHGWEAWALRARGEGAPAAYRAMAMPYWISRAEGDLARLA